MGKLLKYLLLLPVLALSCHEEEQESLIPDYYYGEAYALKNGEEWRPYVIAVNSNACTGCYELLFEILAFGGPGERLRIAPIKEGAGFFPIFLPTDRLSDSLSSTYYTHIGGDALLNFYRVDSTANNFLEIFSFDSVSKEISGRFSVTLVTTRDSEKPRNPSDTIRFNCGNFYTKIVDSWNDPYFPAN